MVSGSNVRSTGSPPRMRGKQKNRISDGSNSRITPAHAGKTCQCRRVDSGTQDHPRACGENAYHSRIKRDFVGSPPRMRGKHRHFAAYRQSQRITPAHAGKTVIGLSYMQRHQDHPRACGENSNVPRAKYAQSGSPPRMRGKLYRYFQWEGA